MDETGPYVMVGTISWVGDSPKKKRIKKVRRIGFAPPKEKKPK